MEQNKNGFPEKYHLFPRLERLGHFLLDQMHYEPTPAAEPVVEPPEQPTERMATVEQNYDGDGRPVEENLDWYREFRW